MNIFEFVPQSKITLNKRILSQWEVINKTDRRCVSYCYKYLNENETANHWNWALNVWSTFKSYIVLSKQWGRTCWINLKNFYSLITSPRIIFIVNEAYSSVMKWHMKQMIRKMCAFIHGIVFKSVNLNWHGFCVIFLINFSTHLQFAYFSFWFFNIDVESNAVT